MGARRERRKESGPSLDREGRQAADAELRVARSRLAFVRGFLWFFLLVNSLIAGLWFLTGQVAFGAVASAFAALYLVAILSLHRYPFGWTLTLAALQTLSVVLSILQGQFPIFWTIVTVMLWGAVPVTARASRLLREHGDVLDAKRMRSRSVKDAPRAEARLHAEERRRAERIRTLRTAGLAAFLALLVGGGGYWAVRISERPLPLEPRLAAFEAALARGDVATAETICSDDVRGAKWRSACRILEREGWLPGGVALREPQTVRSGERLAEIHYALPRGVMKTGWLRQGRDWYLDGIVFQGVREKRAGSREESTETAGEAPPAEDGTEPAASGSDGE